MSDFFDYTWPTARKEHKCEWCGQKILVGEKYCRCTGSWEGDFQNWGMHEECYEDMQLNSDGYDDGFTPYAAERPPKIVTKPPLSGGFDAENNTSNLRTSPNDDILECKRTTT